MPIALHLTSCRAGAQGSVLADDLQRCNKADKEAWEHRVVELGTDPSRLGIIDLAATQALLPELETALHIAQEVHLHGNDVASILKELPYVKPEALASTPLFVHGPCTRNPSDDPDSNIPRLKEWPGPVSYDLAASLSLAPEEQGRGLGADLCALDPWSRLLTPRQGATGPIEGLAEDNAVIVCLSRTLSPTQRSMICERVEALFLACTSPVDVGWIDESKLTVMDARKHRRLAQLFISAQWSDVGCLEAMLSQTPFWVMDEAGESSLGPWLASLGVDPAQHRLAAVQTPDFDQGWQAAIDLWAQGGSLAAKAEYREAVAQRCLSAWDAR